MSLCQAAVDNIAYNTRWALRVITMGIGKRYVFFALFLTAMTSLLAALDIAMEWPMGASEIAIELADRFILVAAIVAIAWTTIQVGDVRSEQKAMRNNLARAVAGGEQWREQSHVHLEGLSSAIESQLRDWSLTPAEMDIAGLFVKGSTLREIAEARETTEATIRQ